MVFEKTFPADAPLADIYAYIDHVMDGTGVHVPHGIEVSLVIAGMGIANERGGVTITVSHTFKPGLVRLHYPQFDHPDDSS